AAAAARAAIGDHAAGDHEARCVEPDHSAAATTTAALLGAQRACGRAATRARREHVAGDVERVAGDQVHRTATVAAGTALRHLAGTSVTATTAAAQHGGRPLCGARDTAVRLSGRR